MAQPWLDSLVHKRSGGQLVFRFADPSGERGGRTPASPLPCLNLPSRPPGPAFPATAATGRTHRVIGVWPLTGALRRCERRRIGGNEATFASTALQSVSPRYRSLLDVPPPIDRSVPPCPGARTPGRLVPRSLSLCRQAQQDVRLDRRMHRAPCLFVLVPERTICSSSRQPKCHVPGIENAGADFRTSP